MQEQLEKGQQGTQGEHQEMEIKLEQEEGSAGQGSEQREQEVRHCLCIASYELELTRCH